MRVALIWPNGFDTIYVMPLALAWLKSNMPAHHDVLVIDCSIDNLSSDSPELLKRLSEFNPNVVGVSTWSPTYFETLDIFKMVKKNFPSVVTVLGGAHASSYAEKIIKEPMIDFIFRGEAEFSFPMFLDELSKDDRDFSKILGLVYYDKNNKLKFNDMERAENLDSIKIPDYNSIRLNDYLQQGYRFNTPYKMNAPIWVTRGCPYRCTFCSAPFQNGKPVRVHSTEYLKNWILFLYKEHKITHFNIIDDNFTFHIEWAKEFCREMIKFKEDQNMNMTFGTPNGIRMQRTDPELLGLMKKAGWDHLVIAPESGSVKTLARMKKDLDPKTVPGIVKNIKAAGLKVHMFFIIGYPGDEVQDVMDSVKLLRECNPDFFFMNNFQPLPGTPVYDELVQSGEIEDGLMPENYSGGARVYTPEPLKNFNFPKLILQEYLLNALRRPTIIPYMFKLISPKMVFKKVLSNIFNMLKNIKNVFRIYRPIEKSF